MSWANIEPVWRCFHCDEVFTDRNLAELHFGSSQVQLPLCKIDGKHVRGLEYMIAAYQREDTPLHRALHRAEYEHRMARQRAEEDGYNRGLIDGMDILKAWRYEPS